MILPPCSEPALLLQLCVHNRRNSRRWDVGRRLAPATAPRPIARSPALWIPQEKAEKPKKEKKLSKKEQKAKDAAEKEAAEAEAAAAKGEGGDDDGDEEPEDLMGDQSWAKTDDFSGALDDMFGDLLGDMAGMKADAEAAGVDINAKVSGMGDSAADEEAEEAKRAEEAAASAKADEEKEAIAAAKREKRANMTKEDKMAKMKCKALEKKGKELKEAGTLVDAARYEEALKLLEDEEWINAEKALKDATSSGEAAPTEAEAEAAPAEAAEEPAAAAEEVKPPAPEPEPEPEQEPEAALAPVAATLTGDMTAAVAGVEAVLNSKAKESDFKKAVALLKAAIDSDKKAGGKQEAVLVGPTSTQHSLSQ